MISPSFLPPPLHFPAPTHSIVLLFFAVGLFLFLFYFFLFLCACVACVCVVSFGICFLLCLTFFTFSTRLLIEAFHSFLLRLRVYPHTHTHTHMCTYCCRTYMLLYIHMYVLVCVCVVRTYIWRLLGAPLPGKCSLILQLVLVKRVQRFSLSLCVCVFTQLLSAYSTHRFNLFGIVYISSSLAKWLSVKLETF